MHYILYLTLYYAKIINEPPHDKTNKVSVRPAKTQISLGIRPVWSESLLCAQWVAKDPRFLHADSEKKTLIRQDGYPGWSESLLGAHSFCWFCHVAAQIVLASLFWEPGLIILARSKLTHTSTQTVWSNLPTKLKTMHWQHSQGFNLAENGNKINLVSLLIRQSLATHPPL